MENINNEENSTPTAEELKEEQEALAETKEEEVRSSIIEKYGLDEDYNEDLIESLTKDTLEQRKAFGKVVGQKIKYREAAKSSKPDKPKEPKDDKPKEETLDVDTLVDSKINQRLDNEFLENSDLSDELQDEVRKLAKAQGISVKKAAQDPYIAYLKEQKANEDKLEDATPRRTKKAVHNKFDVDNPPKVDLSTKEGQEEWEEYKKFLQEQQ